MNFPTNFDINMSELKIPNVTKRSIMIRSGITTLLGPNGSGKTQLLRGIKNQLQHTMQDKIVRYVSAGRLGPLENYRSDYDGQRRGIPRYNNAQYGDLNSVSRRHKTETVIGDFGTLSERTDVLIKVQERLKKLFNRDIRINWDGGYLKVNFNRIDVPCEEYSSAREASGLLHLVAILASLYDDEVGAVLIDEPEVSLHPQLQSFLYDEMIKYQGSPEVPGKKLIFLSTHSTEFINIQSVDDLSSIVFCNDIFEEPIQIDPAIDEFRSRKIQALLARMGQEHKLALFCKRPLLVEGPSDKIMCSGISRALELNLEAAGSQILPVTGKGQMPIVVKLMRLIGKEPSLIADADALSDGMELINVFVNTDKANLLASANGHSSAAKFASSVLSDFSSIAIDKWDEISDIAMNHYYWVTRDKSRGETIPIKRSVLCTLMSMDQSELESLPSSIEWIGIKTRLLSLIRLLKQLGCFILVKGTVESYYRFSDELTSDEKPNAAAIEVSNMKEDSHEVIQEEYRDMVEAIAYAAQSKEINESVAIRNLVLAIVAPALATITDSTTSQELNSNSISTAGKRAKLFDLTIEVTDKKYLVVGLNTSILDVNGFPLRIPVGSNPIVEVNTQLGLV